MAQSEASETPRWHSRLCCFAAPLLPLVSSFPVTAETETALPGSGEGWILLLAGVRAGAGMAAGLASPDGSERLGHGLPGWALSGAVLALSWPAARLRSGRGLPAEAAPTAAAKFLLTTGLSTDVGLTLRPNLAFWRPSGAFVKVASLTTCSTKPPSPLYHGRTPSLKGAQNFGDSTPM